MENGGLGGSTPQRLVGWADITITELNVMEAQMQTTYYETVKPNSFTGRYAGTGSDFKIYFDTLDELKEGIDTIILGRKHLQERLEVDIKIEEEKEDDKDNSERITGST